ncbi:MAG: SUF system NifU family Fe-S cluster assembly protein [Oscillospiraceae bacterium]|jgi:nitrogen fixation NifU-like protein|nr:SUF system NifU family Fe-S cluster assembly protein [Oscillospiraceae bacterium]
MEIDALYSEIITEHSRSSRNRRRMENPTVSRQGVNPSCGDELTLELREDGGVITDASFTGEGCAISKASASMMTDIIRGKSRTEAARLCSAFLGMIKGEQPDAETLDALEDAAALQGVSKMPARVKCAVLPWHTLKSAIEDLKDQ